MDTRIESTQSAQSSVLEVEGLCGGYGKKRIVADVSFQLPRATAMALLGVNGAGKSTLLKTIAHVLPPQAGSIFLEGANIEEQSPAANARQGLVLIPEGGRSFQDLTVAENLEMGGFVLRDPKELKSRMAEVQDIFPRLKARMSQKAGSLSGGERQMLAIGRALMLRPKVLLLDEPFLGLAPIMIEEVVQQLRSLVRRLGCALLVAEQQVAGVLGLVDRVLVVRQGCVQEVSDRLGDMTDVSAVADMLFDRT